MGGSSSKEPESSSDVVMLWIQIRPDPVSQEEARKPMTKGSNSRARTVELDVPSRTTFGEIKQLLKNQHAVFAELPTESWELTISGMDGPPRLFSFPRGFGVPDSNAYMYEVGIKEVAELVAFIPADDET